MKSEEEIRAEIIAIEKTINNYRNAFRNNEIDKSSFRTAFDNQTHMILALRWVLGENDRFD